MAWLHGTPRRPVIEMIIAPFGWSGVSFGGSAIGYFPEKKGHVVRTCPLVNESRSVREHSLVIEIQLIQIHRVRLLILVSVHLVIDGHAVPARASRTVVATGRGSVAVQRDRLEVEVIV